MLHSGRRSTWIESGRRRINDSVRNLHGFFGTPKCLIRCNWATILVVGAGPVGLTMAAELARHGCRPRIIDRAPKPSPYCRALGVTPRTLEVWEDMGIVREMIDAGIWIDAQRFERSKFSRKSAHAGARLNPVTPY